MFVFLELLPDQLEDQEELEDEEDEELEDHQEEPLLAVEEDGELPLPLVPLPLPPPPFRFTRRSSFHFEVPGWDGVTKGTNIAKRILGREREDERVSS